MSVRIEAATVRRGEKRLAAVPARIEAATVVSRDGRCNVAAQPVRIEAAAVLGPECRKRAVQPSKPTFEVPRR